MVMTEVTLLENRLSKKLLHFSQWFSSAKQQSREHKLAVTKLEANKKFKIFFEVQWHCQQKAFRIVAMRIQSTGIGNKIKKIDNLFLVIHKT